MVISGATELHVWIGIWESKLATEKKSKKMMVMSENSTNMKCCYSELFGAWKWWMKKKRELGA